MPYAYLGGLYYILMAEPVTSGESPTVGTEPINVHYDTRLPQLSRWRRVQIPWIAGAAWTLVRVLGPTLHFEELGGHHYGQLHARGECAIAAFWHRCILPSIWYWRNKGVVVMNTTNFDGQWTRRVIERFGFGTAQGSSSRGGLRGLAVMARRLEEGLDVAFTIDGPRGPRYVAKPGPVILARKTRQPIFLFHIGLERAYALKKSWDLMQIPKPFTRAVIVVAPPIYVAADASSEEMDRKYAEMQRTLERVRDIAESWFTLGDEERQRLRAQWNRGA